MRKFHYTILPFFVTNGGERRLECKFNPLDCADLELQTNINDFMARHLSLEFEDNPRLYDLLEKMAIENIKDPLYMEFVLTSVEKVMLVAEGKTIGEVKIKVPVEKVETLYEIQIAIQTFNLTLENILKNDKEEKDANSTIS